MSKQTSLQPTLLIDLKKNRIRIHRKTLYLLGNPEYIQLLVNPASRQIAIKNSIQKDHLAHHVKLINSICYELNSRELICTLQKVKTDLQSNKCYRIYGSYNPKEHIALFSMDDIILFNENTEEQRSV